MDNSNEIALYQITYSEQWDMKLEACCLLFLLYFSQVKKTVYISSLKRTLCSHSLRALFQVNSEYIKTLSGEGYVNLSHPP